MNSLLYAPPDVDQAHAVWGANCGPCSLAAILGRTVDSVRPFFLPGFAARRYVNPTHMKEALHAAGVQWQKSALRFGELPVRGLAFIQWDGPWCQPGVPVTVAYRYTHWIASVGGEVYDVNADEWLHRSEWESDIVPLILEETPKATGWWARTGIEVMS